MAELFFDGEFSGCQKWTRLSRGVDLASGSQIIGMTSEELEELGANEGEQCCLDTLKGRNFENYTDRFGKIVKPIFNMELFFLFDKILDGFRGAFGRAYDESGTGYF